MKHWILLAALLGALALPTAYAASQEKEDPAHDELRALRKQVVAVVNKNDIDGLLELLEKDVVVTWLNGEVSRGPKGVREYLDRMLKGPNAVLKSYETNPEITDLTHLYGDTGVVFGSSQDKYVLRDGQELVVPTQWSATLVKREGKWRIANFHASTNAFDNPILSMTATRTATWAGIIAGVVCLLLGVFLTRLLWRDRH